MSLFKKKEKKTGYGEAASIELAGLSKSVETNIEEDDIDMDDIDFDDEEFDETYDTIDDCNKENDITNDINSNLQENLESVCDSNEDTEEETDDDTEYAFDDEDDTEESESAEVEEVADADEENEDALDDNSEVKLTEDEQIENDIDTELVDKKATKKKSKRKLKNKDAEDEEIVEKKELILYIITDKKIPSMKQYFSSYGVNVSIVFDNIKSATNVIMMQLEPTRLIVIDTGTGKFTNMISRKALIDLIGMCDTETLISVFYTDSVIKAEVINSDKIDDKKVTWHHYKSTADILAYLLSASTKSETYITDRNADEEEDADVTSELLNFTGLSTEIETSKNIGNVTITPDEVIMNFSNINSENEIEGYKVKL